MTQFQVTTSQPPKPVPNQPDDFDRQMMALITRAVVALERIAAKQL